MALFSIWISQISWKEHPFWNISYLSEKGLSVFIGWVLFSLFVFAVSGCLFHFIVTQKASFFFLGLSFTCMVFFDVFLFFVMEGWISLGIPLEKQIVFATWIGFSAKKILFFLGGLFFIISKKEILSCKKSCFLFSLIALSFLFGFVHFGIYQGYFSILYQKIFFIQGIYYSSVFFFVFFLLPVLVQFFIEEKSYFLMAVFLSFVPQIVGESLFFYFAETNFNQILTVLILLTFVSAIPLVFGTILDNFYLFQSLQKLEAMSAQESDRKTRFVNALSHEILNPLNAVMAYNQLLFEGIEGDLNPVQKDTTKKSMQVCERLQNLVEELATLSKAEQGKLGYNREKMDIRKEWEHSLQMVQELAKQKEIEVKLEGGESFLIKADKRRFAQVILNLFLYICHFFDKTQVIVEIKPEKGGFRICVKGRRFSEIKTVDLYSVTNFSLLFSEINVRPFLWISLCRKLLEEQGGGLEISQEGEDLCFYGRAEKA